MMWWVFDEQKLDSELALREARRVQDGATQERARDETVIIKQFLAESDKLLGGRS